MSIQVNSQASQVNYFVSATRDIQRLFYISDIFIHHLQYSLLPSLTGMQLLQWNIYNEEHTACID